MGKTLAEKIIVCDQREGIDPLEIEGSRFAFFKTLFGTSGKMAKINIFGVLFAVPALVWFLYTYILRKTYDLAINYSGNLGLGYEVVEGAVSQGNFARYFAVVQHYAILIPLVILAFIGLGGTFYAMRKLAQGDERIAKSFFKGIKYTIADFFLHGFFAGVVIWIFAINLTIYDAYGYHTVWKVFGLIGSSLLILLLLCYLLYACTMSASYKTSLKAMFKNTYLFSSSFIPQSIVIGLLGAVPVVVLYFTLPALFLNAANWFVALLATLGVSLFLFLGISFVVSAWTVYSDYVYELAFDAAKSAKKQEPKVQKSK